MAPPSYVPGPGSGSADNVDLSQFDLSGIPISAAQAPQCKPLKESPCACHSNHIAVEISDEVWNAFLKNVENEPPMPSPVNENQGYNNFVDPGLLQQQRESLKDSQYTYNSDPIQPQTTTFGL